MPFIPLFDNMPRLFIARPWVTYSLVVATGFTFFWQISLDPAEFQIAVYRYGLIPASFLGNAERPPELQAVPEFLTLATSAFLHGDVWHLLANMVFLWVFGDNVEDSLSHGRFLVFYFGCAAVAGLTQCYAGSDVTIPTIGASGAVAGVLGGYLMLHPRAKVLVLLFNLPVYLPAYLLLAAWIGFQIMAAALDSGVGPGVAWWAHIGGFIAGALLIIPLRQRGIPLLPWYELPRGLTIRARRWQSKGKGG